MSKTIITWEKIKEELTPSEYESFMDWMTGQTVPLNGVYVWDYERWKEK